MITSLFAATSDAAPTGARTTGDGSGVPDHRGCQVALGYAMKHPRHKSPSLEGLTVVLHGSAFACGASDVGQRRC
jgi:hypothetical protein